ncbi:hypothetical protein [Streptomyces gilvus]|uniref:hypothetical protein n=1 Tax=Streptomyces gilvus TaxID=2920937 RepID=UPI001F0D4F57|nr:hypothetical protein [Streptomyces sp. CME 23]MCH5675842.1 hypothetical protein [Streptomyces sp. CME 23]
MTQSGQGEKPSPREAREGIVLPSDGGEPLLPGMLNTQPAAPSGHTGSYGGSSAPPPAGPPASAPPGGQSWGTPWGPDQHQTPAPPPAQSWPTPPDQSWAAPDQWTTSTTSQPLPPANDGYGTPLPPAADEGATQYIPPVTASGMPAGAPVPGSEGATQFLPPVPANGDEAATQYIPPVGPGPLPPEVGPTGGAASGFPGHAPQPGAGTAGFAGHGPQTHAPQGETGPTGFPGSPQAHDPQAGTGATGFAGHTAQTHASQAGSGATGFGAHEAQAHEAQAGMGEAGFGGHGPQGATGFPGAPQSHPPQGATGFPGAPQTHGNPHAGVGPMPVAGSDAQPTQVLPPVTDQGPYGAQPGGDRQPPAEFDNLFRGGPAGDGPAGATQQLPRYEQPPAAQPPYGQQPAPSYGRQAPQPPYDQQPPASYAPPQEERGGRGRSKVPLIAAVGIGIVVIGVGAGALLGGGGGGGKDKNQTVSATAPATDGSSSASAADPAKQQAVALDKLLSDSGNSRASVIAAVANVKACRNLDGAASDLRDAAKQRTQLVTDLSGLSVDKLPNHAELTTALTRAWQASAAADNHYAAWADQVGGAKKGCKKGQARTTGQTAAGNRESGTASQQKARAADLWNAIAQTYGLTQRQPTQL